MQIENTFEIRNAAFGEYEYIITDVNTGEEVETGKFSNSITVAGLDMVMGDFTSNTGMPPSNYFRIGTGSGALTENSTGLSNAVSEQWGNLSFTGSGNVVIGGENYYKGYCTGTFTVMSVSYTITEVGLMNSGNGVFFSVAKVKDSSGNPSSFVLLGNDTSTPQQLTIRYTFYIKYLPTTVSMGSGSFVLNSTTYNYTITARFPSTTSNYATKWPFYINTISTLNASETVLATGSVSTTFTKGSVAGYGTTVNSKEYQVACSYDLAPGSFTGTFRGIRIGNNGFYYIIFDQDITKTSTQRLRFNFTSNVIIDNTSVVVS